MKVSFILLVVSATVISACSSSGNQSPSSAKPPPKQDNPKPDGPQPAPSRVSPVDTKTCPFVELAGTYSVSKTECSIDGRQDVEPDPSIIPEKYVVSSQRDSGAVDLIFVDSSGNEKSTRFEFPRLPAADDFKNFGIQCGNLENSKSLSWRCPGTTGTKCLYGLQFDSGKLIAVYVRVENSIYGCRSELTKDLSSP